jgi:SAM-dependent methyltransferase
LPLIESHYRALLGSRYTWMMGGAERCLASARELLDFAQLPTSGGTALDLGCGAGFHARALAERGLSVVAVDSSTDLLAELRTVCADCDVEAINGDLTDLRAVERRGPFAAILCVGDTLTHLETHEAVNRLVVDAAQRLAPEGVLVFEFREQPQTMSANDSVFTVRSDRDRIMQCVLRFEPDRVWVTDVVHEWDGQAWHTMKSTYPKLRLATDDLVARAQAAGLSAHVNAMRAGRRVLAFKRG